MTTPDRSEDLPLEADPADVEEQHAPVTPEEDEDLVPPVHLTNEVSEADAVEQAEEVYDDEEEPR